MLLPVSNLATARAVSVAYWLCTALTAFFFVSGGLAYALEGTQQSAQPTAGNRSSA